MTTQLQEEHMTKDEALKQAREWIKAQPRGWMTDGFNEVIADINEALARPAQEPEVECDPKDLCAGCQCHLSHLTQEPVALECTYGYSQCQALAVAQQKRPWVGLTTDELIMIGDSMRTWNSWSITDVYTAIEAKLKEKNG